MKRVRFGAAFTVALVVSMSAWSTARADIPISISSATLVVSLDDNIGPDVTTQISGAPPHTLPYNLTDGSCAADGTATLSSASGRIRVEVAGQISGTASCTLDIDVRESVSGFEVPDLGESSTPVLFGIDHVTNQLTGPLQRRLGWAVNQYDSVLVGARVEGIGDNMDSSFGGPQRVATLFPMVPGDTVSFGTTSPFSSSPSISINNDATAGVYTYDEEFDFFVDLPPDVQQAVIPPQVGILVGGVLIGLGIKLTRRPARA